jgi:PAS domain S-box-containing protein
VDRTQSRPLTQAQLRRLLDVAPDGMVCVSDEGRILEANAQAEALFEYEHGGLTGKPVEVLVPERFRAAHGAHIEGYFRDPRTRAMGDGLELHGLRRSGREFPAEISLSGLELGGRPVAIAAIRDISDRMAAERRFQQLLELSPDGVLAVDRDGRIQIVNGQVEAIFGYRREELVGQQVEMLLPPAQRATHVGHRTGFAAEPRTRPMGLGQTLFGLRRDGTQFPCEIALSSIETGEGTLFVAAVRDTTERLLAEATASEESHRRVILGAMLQAEERERSRIANELHDDAIQVMVASCLTLDRIAARLPGGNDEVAALLAKARETLETATERCRRLTFDLRPVLLHEQGLHGAVAAMADHLISDTGAEVYVRVARERYEASVEEVVYRTLVEVLTNVRKHAKARHVAVSIDRIGDWLTSMVADDGVGFDTAAVSKRDDALLHMGIGSITERVRMSGGHLSISSGPGLGTSVTFRLPVELEAPRPGVE